MGLKGIKDNSRRKFPGVGGRRHNPIGTKQKRLDALGRNAAWANLTPFEQLKELDRRLGHDTGATRQRARIAAAATKPTQVKAPSGPAVRPEPKAKETAKARHQRGA